MLEPRPVGWGGNSRILAVRQETRSSGRYRGSRTTPVEPPPNVADNKYMTIRRRYNKAALRSHQDMIPVGSRYLDELQKRGTTFCFLERQRQGRRRTSHCSHAVLW